MQTMTENTQTVTKPIPKGHILTVQRLPNPILRRKCTPVQFRYNPPRGGDCYEFADDPLNPDIPQLAASMLKTMYEYGGVGLAAPQIGQSLRMFVCSHTRDLKDAMVCINPEFIEMSNPIEGIDEGCLSLPGVAIRTRRAGYVKMRAIDLDGREFVAADYGVRAVIWQHEMDHLDGKLIIDNMSESDLIRNRKALRALGVKK